MIEFTSLYLFLMGMISCAQGQRLAISTKFTNGSLIFTWNSISTLRNDIIITKDSQRSPWIRVNDNRYTVEDVLQYKSVSIMVREYNTSDFRSHVDYKKTYHVNTIESKEGESRNISWTAEYFPKSGTFFIFHKNNSSVSKIITVTEKYSLNSEKYVYHTRPFNSTNILFEVRNITVEDAGFYVGSSLEADALSGREGVVLIVSGKPLKPIINGDLNIEVRNYTYLKCESRSTSAPYYYKKFPPLSYSWFVNNARVDGEDRKTYRFNVSKEDKYNRYRCQAKETLESEKSEGILLNPLYGPESVIITPLLPNNRLSIHDGDLFGPYICSADCNPPCTLQWKYKNPSGGFSEVTPIGYSSVILPAQTANRTSMASIRCVVNGTEGRKVLEIGLNIQYLLNPKAIINGRPRDTVTVNERNALILSCLVEGNPTPEVTLRKLTGNTVIGKNRLNYTFIREAQCSDTSTYSCEGKSTEFRSKNLSFNMNVLCMYTLSSLFV